MPTYNERVLDELHKIKSGVSSMCIDTGAGEICTSSIGTGSTVTIYADGEVQAGCRRFESVQEMVDYVSNRPEEWEGETSEEGLEEWAAEWTIDETTHMNDWGICADPTDNIVRSPAERSDHRHTVVRYNP